MRHKGIARHTALKTWHGIRERVEGEMKTDYSDQKHGGAKGKPGGKKPPMVKEFEKRIFQ